ncbi:MAG: DUF5666 domain-containing protein [Bauldia litoralis]
MTHWKHLLGVTAAASVLALPATAANAQEVSTAADNEWISLTGTVSQVTSNDFTLDYNGSEIEVVTSDSQWFSGNALSRGDRVTVTGLLDRGFYDNRELDARSVYMIDQEELFSDPEAEAEGYYSGYLGAVPEGDEMLTVTGRVTEIDNELFTLDTGGQTYRVDVVTLAENPLDDPLTDENEGRVEVGERVVVTGRMDASDLFEARAIEASRVIELSPTG